MTYTFDQLKDDVRKEAEALRVHATKEERERLDIKKLDPNDENYCVYGQTFGDCDNDRATELIMKCAPVLFEGNSTTSDLFPTNEFAKHHWSPIEIYIYDPKANNANLIAYLRGETETLEL